MKQKIVISVILAFSLAAPALAKDGVRSGETSGQTEVRHQAVEVAETEHPVTTGEDRLTGTAEEKAAHCAVRTDRLNDHVAKANTHIDKREKHEQNIVTHVQRVLAKYEAAPFNVSKTDARVVAVEQDLAKLQAQINQNIADHKKYVTDLQAVSTAACGSRKAVRETAQADLQKWQSDWGSAKPLHAQLFKDLAALISSANKAQAKSHQSQDNGGEK